MMRIAKLVLGAFAFAVTIPCFAAEPAPTPACAPHWQDDVFDALDRCIDGDGQGCDRVGRDYEIACDPYASIKWYERGCGLGSAAACSSLARVTPSRR